MKNEKHSEQMPQCHVRDGGTGVSNFDLHMIECYIEAVQRYGDKNLVVSDAPFGNCATNCGSLHDLARFSGRGDQGLSPFWRIFYEVKKEMELSELDVK